MTWLVCVGGVADGRTVDFGNRDHLRVAEYIPLGFPSKESRAETRQQVYVRAKVITKKGALEFAVPETHTEYEAVFHLLEVHAERVRRQEAQDRALLGSEP